MGFFDAIGDVVSETAEKVEKGAEWVGKVAEKVGLDKIADAAKSVSKYAGRLAVAPTPILRNGQKVIEKMLKATGEGDPERAESFGNSSRKFKASHDTLAKAHAGQGWEGGTASKAYNERTGEQVNWVTTLADGDSQVATIVSREADQLNGVRKILHYNHQLLADVASHTQWLGSLGPEGKALQATIEGFYVGMAMDQCVPKIWQMHNEANANAAALRQVTNTMYQQVASGVVVSDSSNDFDPPGGLSSKPDPGSGQPGDPKNPAPPGSDPVPAPAVPSSRGTAPGSGPHGASASASTLRASAPAHAANFSGGGGGSGVSASQFSQTPGQRPAPPNRAHSPTAGESLLPPVSNDIDGASSGTSGERAPLRPVDEASESPSSSPSTDG
ncbi:EspA/EspE family type VII secretion system effector [Mycobacterium celatum]|uniref:ESX-1 secretion-associated protein EspA/EspE-like domain-containing protein n=1 Tax=Mycobacterium celatum TaxID=28045 RepID=A0A1X1RIW0_MYCCE|nr:EspA/EspE family type VII secretion system effector [Mycobacterium celatum]ORV06971.1 hypothetical protein AWB95_21520 [Mycobacterium celatum]PIB78218.1 hypothetical protein CQY23_15075 [Mycobacterium celatum]